MDVQQQINDIRSTLAQKGTLTAADVKNTLDKLVNVTENLASQIGEVDRLMRAADGLTSQISDIHDRLARMQHQAADVQRQQ